MLEPAIKYRDQLENVQYDTWFNDKYKYWNSDVFYGSMQIDTDTWGRHQFVSVKNGVVIGYIEYSISRTSNSVSSLSIMNFSDNKIVFGKDLIQALEDIFEKYKFRKINFSVIIGNPIEKSYDKMIKKYGGRIVGIYKDDAVLIDGKCYDRKLYEILASEYFDTKNNSQFNENNLNKEIREHLSSSINTIKTTMVDYTNNAILG